LSKNYWKTKKNSKNVLFVKQGQPMLFYFNQTDVGWDALKVVGNFRTSLESHSYHTRYACSAD
jgi:hypothetical protein